MVRRSLVVVLLVAAVSLFAQQPTVTKVAIVVNPKAYTGPCPATLKFTATVFVSHHPVWIEYRWERSDGAKTSPQRLQIHAAGQGISEEWHLGAGHQHMRVWERLHVLAPTGISSPEAVATVTCR